MLKKGITYHDIIFSYEILNFSSKNADIIQKFGQNFFLCKLLEIYHDCLDLVILKILTEEGHSQKSPGLVG